MVLFQQADVVFVAVDDEFTEGLFETQQGVLVEEVLAVVEEDGHQFADLHQFQYRLLLLLQLLQHPHEVLCLEIVAVLLFGLVVNVKAEFL